MSILATVSGDDAPTDGVIYTVPTGKSARIDTWSYCLKENNDRQPIFWVRKSGDAAGTAKCRIASPFCAGSNNATGDGYTIRGPITLTDGDKLAITNDFLGSGRTTSLVFGIEDASPTTYGVIAQGTLSSTLTDIYTVPGGQKLYIASMLIHNQNSSTPRQITLGFAPLGAADNLRQHYLEQYGLTELGTYWIDGGMILDATDKIRAKQDSGTDCSYSIFGWVV